MRSSNSKLWMVMMTTGLVVSIGSAHANEEADKAKRRASEFTRNARTDTKTELRSVGRELQGQLDSARDQMSRELKKGQSNLDRARDRVENFVKDKIESFKRQGQDIEKAYKRDIEKLEKASKDAVEDLKTQLNGDEYSYVSVKNKDRNTGLIFTNLKTGKFYRLDYKTGTVRRFEPSASARQAIVEKGKLASLAEMFDLVSEDIKATADQAAEDNKDKIKDASKDVEKSGQKIEKTARDLIKSLSDLVKADKPKAQTEKVVEEGVLDESQLEEQGQTTTESGH